MPQFSINSEMNQKNCFKEGERRFWKLKLTDEWAILCELTDSVQGFTSSIKSIGVLRKYTAGEHSLSGEFKICAANGHVRWEKKFSQIITTGSIAMNIFLFKEFKICFYDPAYAWLNGVVNISDSLEKCANALENGKSKEGNHVKSLEELSNHLERLLDPGASCFADVTIKCGNAVIPAHKIILSARSPVFAAMFSNPMRENHKREVYVTDIDVAILRALINYMYTGKTKELSASLAADLLFAADKYQIEDLKRVCCDVLKDTVALQNVLRILVLGDLHAEDLKLFAVDYIRKKCADFSVLEKSEEWKTLRKERPQLALDVLSSLVNTRMNN